MSYISFCFSPTGGTRKVLSSVLRGWNVPFHSVDLMTPVQKKYYKAEDLCLFAVPSYGGRVPSVVVDRIRDLWGNGARAVLIVVYGNREVEDTLLELSDELNKAGFRCVAAITAIAQHSLLPDIASGRPDEHDKAQLQQFGKELAEKLERGELTEKVSVPGNRPYREYKGVPLKPMASGHCIGCGRCAAQCPVNAISQLNYKNTDTRVCISCMRCVLVCPVHIRKVNPLMVRAATLGMKKKCSVPKENQLIL